MFDYKMTVNKMTPNMPVAKINVNESRQRCQCTK